MATADLAQASSLSRNAKGILRFQVGIGGFTAVIALLSLMMCGPYDPYKGSYLPIFDIGVLLAAIALGVIRTRWYAFFLEAILVCAAGLACLGYCLSSILYSQFAIWSVIALILSQYICFRCVKVLLQRGVEAFRATFTPSGT